MIATLAKKLVVNDEVLIRYMRGDIPARVSEQPMWSKAYDAYMIRTESDKYGIKWFSHKQLLNPSDASMKVWMGRKDNVSDEDFKDRGEAVST